MSRNAATGRLTEDRIIRLTELAEATRFSETRVENHELRMLLTELQERRAADAEAAKDAEEAWIAYDKQHPLQQSYAPYTCYRNFIAGFHAGRAVKPEEA